MTFEEFRQVFNYSDTDFSRHKLIVMFNPPCDSDNFLGYFIENVENLTEIHHLFLNNRVFVITNKDIIYKDTLAEHIEILEPVVEIIESQTSDGDPA